MNTLLFILAAVWLVIVVTIVAVVLAAYAEDRETARLLKTWEKKK
jgi:hypothetical protein